MSSSRQRLFKGLLFLGLPLLCAVAAYGHARGAKVRGDPAEKQAKAREIREMPRLTQVEAALDAARERAHAALPPPKPEPVDAEGLKKRLLERVAELAGGGLLEDETGDLISKLFDLEGAAAVAWVEEHLPEEYHHEAVKAWAAADPDGAFEHLASRRHRLPCGADLVMDLLSHKAEAGAAALREAVERIPWDLLPPGNPGVPDLVLIPESPSLEEAQDFRIWHESGALRYLAEQGVEVDGTFEAWGKLDPHEAVREWADWPNLNGPRADRELEAIVTAGEAWNPAAVDRLADLLEETEGPVHGRIVDWMRRFPDENMDPEALARFKGLPGKEEAR